MSDDDAPSFWDVVVGIDLDDWMRADSGEQIRWLAYLRDHPMPGPPVPPRPGPCDSCITGASFGSRFTSSICGGFDCR